MRWLVRAGFVLAFVYVFPYFEALRNANEIPRVLLTEEIVEHGTFRLDARWSELALGSTFDVATTPDGHRFSNKAPGTSLLGVPAYLALKGWHRLVGGSPSLAEATWACRLFTQTLPVLLFLAAFWVLARRFAPPRAAEAALLALAFGSMAFPYAMLLFSHGLSLACAGGAFVCAVLLVRGPLRRPWSAALAVGFLGGWAVLADYQAAFALLVIVAYVAWGSDRRLRDLGFLVLGGCAPAVLLAWYHTACFGSPLRTGYSFAADPAHKQGLLGMIGPNAQAFGQALVAVDNGLLVLMPWVVLALVGGIAIARDPVARARLGAEALVCAIIALGYVLFIGSLVPEFGRAGWSVGPRYIAVALPSFAWLAAAGFGAIDDKPAARALAHGLVLTAVVIMVVAGTTFPTWPTSVRNPLFELSLWLIGQGRAPHTLGAWLGLSGWSALVPVYAVIAALVLGLLGRGRWGSMVGALALVVVLLAALGHAPRTPGIERQQRFVESVWEPR